MMKAAYAKIMKKCREECREKFIADYSGLVRKTVGAVLRLANVPHTPEDIRELRNDVFLEILKNECKKLKMFDRGKKSFNGWIRLIANQTTKGRIRKKEVLGLRNRPFFEELEDIEEILRYDEDFESREKLRIVEETIETMSKRDRFILIQAFYHWKSLKELSSEIGDSYGTVAKRLHDARRRLKKQVEDRFKEMKGDNS